MRLLLVEDDAKIASFMLKGFKQSSFAVDHATDGEDGLHLASTEPYDVAIIDVMLPKRDGLSLIEELRRRSVNLPAIIVSAKHSVDDRIAGLRRGGDDYIVKPFAFSELLARVHAVIRRASGAADSTKYKVADLHLDLVTRAVTRSGKRLDLQPLEFSLLVYLMRNAGRVVSKTMITEHVWDYNFDPQTNVVEARMCRLRDKVDRGFPVRLIHTIRGVGYVLREDA